MRAISFDYDHEAKSVETIIIFDNKLAEEEEKNMEVAHTEVLADVHNVVTGYCFLTIKVVPSSECIQDYCGTWG